MPWWPPAALLLPALFLLPWHARQLRKQLHDIHHALWQHQEQGATSAMAHTGKLKREILAASAHRFEEKA